MFPDKCIRGIINRSGLEDDHTANINLFPFHDYGCRTDGWIPESINWMDSENVIGFTLNQKNDDGGLQFTVGIAVLPRNELDRLRRRTGFLDGLKYERDPLPKNDYHGNILLSNNLSKTKKKMIRYMLAVAADIQLRPE